MINCKNCQKTFETTIHRTTFCCHRCQGSFNFKNLKNRTTKKKNGKNIICNVCKTVFYVRKCRISKAKYCSRSCLAKDLLPKYVVNYGFKPLGKPKHKYKTIYINGKQQRLHRYIMEQHLGRKLERWEHVHHINDNSFDNRIENLIVLSNSEHQKAEYKHRKKIISSSSCAF